MGIIISFLWSNRKVTLETTFAAANQPYASYPSFNSRFVGYIPQNATLPNHLSWLQKLLILASFFTAIGYLWLSMTYLVYVCELPSFFMAKETKRKHRSSRDTPLLVLQVNDHKSVAIRLTVSTEMTKRRWRSWWKITGSV